MIFSNCIKIRANNWVTSSWNPFKIFIIIFPILILLHQIIRINTHLVDLLGGAATDAIFILYLMSEVLVFLFVYWFILV